MACLAPRQCAWKTFETFGEMVAKLVPPNVFIPKCSILNGESKSFSFPHYLGLRLCRHTYFSPPSEPREPRCYAAMFISPEDWDPEKAKAMEESLRCALHLD